VSEGGPREINASTRYCAVLGHPVSHSASPAMHNAALAALGLNWRYLAFDVHPENLRTAISGAKAMQFIGLNLTVPHKLLAVEMVDELDESARTWGAVNTVRYEAREASGEWKPLIEFGDAVPASIRTRGFNTDADAIIRALHADLDLQLLGGAGVLLLGAGGAGRVAALRLAAEGVGVLYLVNRTVKKAEDLAAEIRRRYPQQQVRIGYPKGSIDMVINATSLGLGPDDAMPLDENKFALRQSHAAYDMIYRPAETPLLKAAKAAGCRTANGLGMLLYQGAKALELWTGQQAPIAVMRRALETNIYGN
jgi:shikimate dehydrogenase